MIVIGIHNAGVTSSAAIVVDGKLEFGCAEERLDRRKYSKYFPNLAIEACLDWVGAKLSDVSCFAIGWNPAINNGARYRAGHSQLAAYARARPYSHAHQLMPQLALGEFTATDQIFDAADGKTQITYVTHHLAHCAAAFYLSSFDDAALFSCDGYGERTTTVWATAKGAEISMLRQIKFPHSIG